MVGTVGRTDLLGTSREELDRPYRSLRDEILTLPDDLLVYPTHGAGSFCPRRRRRSHDDHRTGAWNEPSCRPRDEYTFVELLLARFGSFPTYFYASPR